MKNRFSVVHFAWIGLICLFNQNAVRADGLDFSDMNWGALSDNITVNGKQFEGNWKKTYKWDGLLCDGYFRSSANIVGKVGKIKFKLKGAKAMDISATVNDVGVRVTGELQTEPLCVPIGPTIGALLDSVDIQSHVDFIDKGEGQAPGIKLQIQSIQISRIRFSEWLPDRIEEILTSLINSGIREVWHTRLGEWINEKISEEIGKHFPPQIQE